MDLNEQHPERVTPVKSRNLRFGYIVRVIITLIFLAAAGAGGLLYYANLLFQAKGPDASDGAVTVFDVPPGHGLVQISNRLEARGLIENSLIFRAGVICHRSEDKLRAGEYSIPSGASMLEIMKILCAGKVILHKLTIPEGLTSAQVVRMIEAEESLTGEIGETPAEGSVLPETYFFPRGTARCGLVERMMQSRTEVLAELWGSRAKDLPIKTPEEAVILASIVEKETSLPEERPRVASVFINRMRKRMRLASDPTVVYGLTGGEPLGHGIRRSELKEITPYNTYEIDGLPPTPIANPGRDAIAAVLNPEDTNYLYFVADGTGGHVFASSYQEHQQNVASWRRIERQMKNSQ